MPSSPRITDRPSLIKAGSSARSSWQRFCIIVGALLIAAIYLGTVLTQPTDAAIGATNVPAAVLFVGYLVAALFLLAGTLPGLSVGTIVLIPVGLVLNILLGQFVGSSLVPLYLDSMGTILIAFLAGRSAAVATGILGNLVWSLFNPTLLPFAAVAAVVGFCAGTAGRWGAVRRIWSAPIFGFVSGLISATISAPIAAFVYGGTSGAATGAIVTAFRAYGDSILQATTKQALITDPGDKAISFLLVALLIYALPQRTVRRISETR
ncbi:ECF transporter S component [Rothia uropygialis]|uniref:ECF transporter S component n=1 Tax=Kocuria sp. 36 TaxID=1415402 RepID=UPI00101D7227|nr:ECF transporter S component [Kocuria sp. 36]